MESHWSMKTQKSRMLFLSPFQDGNGIHRRQTKPCSTYKSNLTYGLVKETLGKTILGKITKVKIQKYVAVQSWKAAHLPTLEIRVEQKRNRVKKERKIGEKRKKKSMLPRPGIEPGTCR